MFISSFEDQLSGIEKPEGFVNCNCGCFKYQKKIVNKVQGRLLEKSGNFLSNKAGPVRIGVDRGSKFCAGCQFIFVQSRAPECFSRRGLPSYESPVGKRKACQESENLLQDLACLKKADTNGKL